ncbi:uncharacterized protein PAC_16373 [Phialocephala subalpina]|uniref:SsuA/THI5-like domain-containing protein n=1 Tax=Phialocephala subalpina TaxID=576137 RepID=A0A1L7XN62_9HELO|nr:uncharacterized protein PAC_16373 [Phialocephala subalpina]
MLPNLPLHCDCLCLRQRFFTAYGLDVVYQQVPNSTYAYAQTFSGGYDILTGTIDNSVNLRLNSNENITVIGQLDQGPDLVLASNPNITSVAQLKSKSLIVDSPTSGYSYLLRKILSIYGLFLNTDYFFQTVEGTNLRYADLVVGKLPNGTTVYATMLVYPFTTEGEALPTAQRPNILARVSDPISSSAFTARQSALSNCTENDVLVRFMSVIHAANLYLRNPAQKTCSLEYNAATAADTGDVSPGGPFTVNQTGLLNVMAVREEFNGFSSLPSEYNFAAAIVPDEGKLIDYSIRDLVVASLKKDLLETTR